MYRSLLQVSLLLSSKALISRVYADPYRVQPSETCTQYQGVGRSVYCCSGACYDGTSIGVKGGLCETWSNPCTDPQSTVCSSNSVYHWRGDCDASDLNFGCCHGGCECSWGSDCFKWECCPCPDGTIAVFPQCGATQKNAGWCFGCSGPAESILFNPVSTSYVCDSTPFRQKACDFEKSISSAVSTANTVSTWISAFCPTKNVIGSITNILQDVIGALNYVRDPSQENAASLKANVFSTINSWYVGIGVALLIAPEAVVPASALLETYEAICLASGVSGSITTIAEEALGWASSSTCPPAITKRDEYENHDLDHISLQRKAAPTPSNACAQFVASFPSGTSLASAMQAACNTLGQYTSEDTLTFGVAASANDLQPVCSAMLGSNNFTIFSDFEDVIAAVQAAIPVCNGNVTSSSTTTTSPTSTKQSSSTTTLTSKTASTSSSISTRTSITRSSTSPSVVSKSSTTAVVTSSSFSVVTSSTSSPKTSKMVVSTSSGGTSTTRSSISSTGIVSSTSVTTVSSSKLTVTTILSSSTSKASTLSGGTSVLSSMSTGQSSSIKSTTTNVVITTSPSSVLSSSKPVTPSTRGTTVSGTSSLVSASTKTSQSTPSTTTKSSISSSATTTTSATTAKSILSTSTATSTTTIKVLSTSQSSKATTPASTQSTSTITKTTTPASSTKTSSSATATSSTTTQNSTIAGNYQQCGGSTWTGATTCHTGWNCTNTDPNYWQCWPRPYNSTYCINHMFDDCGGSSFNGTKCCPEGAVCMPVNQWTNTCQWPQ